MSVAGDVLLFADGVRLLSREDGRVCFDPALLPATRAAVSELGRILKGLR